MGSSATEGLNYFPYLAQQPTPPSSSRTMPGQHGAFGGGGGGGGGGQTTRRSLPKNLHGNYEGDLSMFTSRTCHSNASLVDAIIDSGFDFHLEQIAEARVIQQQQQQWQVNEESEKFDRHGNEPDQIKLSLKQQRKVAAAAALAAAAAATAETSPAHAAKKCSTPKPAPAPASASTPSMPSHPLNYWQRYKTNILSSNICKKFDLALSAMESHAMVHKLRNVAKIAALVLSSILRILLLNLIVRAINLNWDAMRYRFLMRKGSRGLLWHMTLAKYGDFRLFALIMLLAPLLFLIAAFGFVFTLYSLLKDGIFHFLHWIRNIEIEVPQPVE